MVDMILNIDKDSDLESAIEANPNLQKSLSKGGMDKKSAAKKSEPIYRVVGSTKVPVSKSMGKVWSSRKDQAIAKRKSSGILTSWDEALRYYNDDQMSHRETSDGKSSANKEVSRRLNDNWSETENIVFANTNAIVPALYAKNPEGEFTATAAENEDLAIVVEQLVNRLGSMKSSPGVNLKPKAKRAVVMCTLTNCAYLEIGYNFKAQSSEQAFSDLQTLSKELENAKTAKEIERVEGALQALEEKIDLLQPEGPWVKYRRPHQVLVDCDNDDDPTWMMVYDYVSTSYLQAVYGTRDGNDETSNRDQYKSVYQPTHVLNVDVDATDDADNSYSILMPEESKLNGYSDEYAYKKAQRTKVWYIWDKTTRRLYMFNDRDWTWPIWVWDDPYKLDSFFPFYKLSFYTAPEGGDAKGEVTHYLDQQDAINEINSEERTARQWARRNVLYNKNVISAKDVDAILTGDKPFALGLDIAEDQDINKAIFSMVPPSMQFTQLFDKTSKLAAIDRVSSVQDFLRGSQFKTNTTNDAIATYSSTSQTRLDEKIDAIEDLLGDVYWGIAQLCLMYMAGDKVAAIVGQQRAQLWRNMSPEEIAGSFNVRVVGGSTIKPTSQQKKKEAMEVGQILGQFASATPAVVIVLMKVFSRAFDEIALTDEEWKFLMEGIQQQMQVSNGGGAASASASGDPTQSAPDVSGGSGGGGDPLAEVAQLVDSLPDAAKIALGKSMAKGVPVSEALPRILEMAQEQQGQEQSQSQEPLITAT